MCINETEAAFKAYLSSIQIELSTQQTRKYSQYAALLQKWNQVYNLTAITSTPDIFCRHFMDSVSILPFLQGTEFLDVGSGAGFPGLPLAIAAPDLQFNLLEVLGKRVQFLTQAVYELGLPNVSVTQARVEEYAPTKKLPGIVCRAFSSLLDFAQKTRPLLSEAGRLYGMKGVLGVEERVEVAGIAEITAVIPLTYPGIKSERQLIILRPRKVLS